MTLEELDAKALDAAKRLDETPIDDYEQMREILKEMEEIRLEFVKLYGLDKEEE